MPKILYWDALIGDERILSKYTDTLEKLLAGDYKSADLDLKRYPHLRIYSIKCNDAGRLLFATVDVNGERCLLLLDELETHDYKKSVLKLSAKQIKAYVDDISKLSELPQDMAHYHFEAVDEIEGLETAPAEKITYKPAHFFNQQFIELNETQTDVLKAPLPLFVFGGPGAGKSCAAFGLLIDAYKQSNHQEDAASNVSKPILYVTKSDPLLKSMKRMWREHPMINAPRDAVQFTTYNKLLEKYAQRSINGRKPVGLQTFTDWYKEQHLPSVHRLEKMAQGARHKEPAVDAPNAEVVYQEFRIISAFAEDYLELGQKQCLIRDPAVRAFVQTAYVNYELFLEECELYDPAFETMKAESDYQLIVLDEAQDLSLKQLMQLSQLCDNQIAYCSDVRQGIADAWSNRELLNQLFRSSGRELAQIELTALYRCPAKIIQAANAMKDVEVIFSGGYADKIGDGHVIAADHLEEKGHVYWVEDYKALETDHFTQLAKRFDFAVVTHPEHKEQAKAIFKTGLIFTPSEIKGLEFSRILFFRFLESDQLIQANRWLREQTRNGHSLQQKAYGHRAKQGRSNTQFTKDLHGLFTGVTRSRKELYLVQNNQHATSELFKELRQRIETDPHYEAAADEAVTNSDDKQHWLDVAQDLKARGFADQARDILNIHFADDPEAMMTVLGSPQSDLPNEPSYENDNDKAITIAHKAERALHCDDTTFVDLNQTKLSHEHARLKKIVVELSRKNLTLQQFRRCVKSFKTKPSEKEQLELKTIFHPPGTKKGLKVNLKTWILIRGSQIPNMEADDLSESSFGEYDNQSEETYTLYKVDEGEYLPCLVATSGLLFYENIVKSGKKVEATALPESVAPIDFLCSSHLCIQYLTEPSATKHVTTTINALLNCTMDLLPTLPSNQIYFHMVDNILEEWGTILLNTPLEKLGISRSVLKKWPQHAESSFMRFAFSNPDFAQCYLGSDPNNYLGSKRARQMQMRDWLSSAAGIRVFYYLMQHYPQDMQDMLDKEALFGSEYFGIGIYTFLILMLSQLPTCHDVIILTIKSLLDHCADLFANQAPLSFSRWMSVNDNKINILFPLTTTEAGCALLCRLLSLNPDISEFFDSIPFITFLSKVLYHNSFMKSAITRDVLRFFAKGPSASKVIQARVPKLSMVFEYDYSDRDQFDGIFHTCQHLDSPILPRLDPERGLASKLSMLLDHNFLNPDPNAVLGLLNTNYINPNTLFNTELPSNNMLIDVIAHSPELVDLYIRQLTQHPVFSIHFCDDAMFIRHGSELNIADATPASVTRLMVSNHGRKLVKHLIDNTATFAHKIMPLHINSHILDKHTGSAAVESSVMYSLFQDQSGLDILKSLIRKNPYLFQSLTINDFVRPSIQYDIVVGTTEPFFDQIVLCPEKLTVLWELIAINPRLEGLLSTLLLSSTLHEHPALTRRDAMHACEIGREILCSQNLDTSTAEQTNAASFLTTLGPEETVTTLSEIKLYSQGFNDTNIISKHADYPHLITQVLHAAMSKDIDALGYALSRILRSKDAEKIFYKTILTWNGEMGNLITFFATASPQTKKLFAQFIESEPASDSSIFTVENITGRYLLTKSPEYSLTNNLFHIIRSDTLRPAFFNRKHIARGLTRQRMYAALLPSNQIMLARNLMEAYLLHLSDDELHTHSNIFYYNPGLAHDMPIELVKHVIELDVLLLVLTNSPDVLRRIVYSKYLLFTHNDSPCFNLEFLLQSPYATKLILLMLSQYPAQMKEFFTESFLFSSQIELGSNADPDKPVLMNFFEYFYFEDSDESHDILILILGKNPSLMKKVPHEKWIKSIHRSDFFSLKQGHTTECLQLLLLKEVPGFLKSFTVDEIPSDLWQSWSRDLFGRNVLNLFIKHGSSDTRAAAKQASASITSILSCSSSAFFTATDVMLSTSDIKDRIYYSPIPRSPHILDHHLDIATRVARTLYDDFTPEKVEKFLQLKDTENFFFLAPVYTHRTLAHALLHSPEKMQILIDVLHDQPKLATVFHCPTMTLGIFSKQNDDYIEPLVATCLRYQTGRDLLNTLLDVNPYFVHALSSRALFYFIDERPHSDRVMNHWREFCAEPQIIDLLHRMIEQNPLLATCLNCTDIMEHFPHSDDNSDDQAISALHFFAKDPQYHGFLHLLLAKNDRIRSQITPSGLDEVDHNQRSIREYLMQSIFGYACIDLIASEDPLQSVIEADTECSQSFSLR